jgi:hypothetical protein
VAELFALSQQAPEELNCCITLGYDAEDTIGNARETRRLDGGKRIPQPACGYR